MQWHTSSPGLRQKGSTVQGILDSHFYGFKPCYLDPEDTNQNLLRLQKMHQHIMSGCKRFSSSKNKWWSHILWGSGPVALIFQIATQTLLTRTFCTYLLMMYHNIRFTCKRFSIFKKKKKKKSHGHTLFENLWPVTFIFLSATQTLQESVKWNINTSTQSLNDQVQQFRWYSTVSFEELNSVTPTIKTAL